MGTVQTKLGTWLLISTVSVAAFFAAFNARAQITQSVAITLTNCSGTGGGDTQMGSCTILPAASFGTMSVTINIGAPGNNTHIYSVIFMFQSANGSFSATDEDQGGISTATTGDIMGTATINAGSGTGSLLGLSGSFTYNLSGAGTFTSQSFTLTGSGFAQIPAQELTQQMDNQVILSQQQFNVTVTQQDQQENQQNTINEYFQTFSSVAQNKASTSNKMAQTFNSSLAMPWATVTPASATLPPDSSVTSTISIDPAGLSPGTYQGSVTVTISPDDASGQFHPVSSEATSQGSATSSSVIQTVNVNLTVTAASSDLALSQSGLQFQAVAGAAAPAVQTVLVTSSAAAATPFTVSPASQGNWLSATPTTGTVSMNQPATISIGVNPSGLENNTVYFGGLDIAAPGAGNSPQWVEVVLSVGSAAPIQLFPTGLVFTSGAGPQTFSIADPSNQTYGIQITTTYASGNNWLSLSTMSPQAVPEGLVPVTVTPSAAGLSPGVYNATLNVTNVTIGGSQQLSVTMVVPAQAVSDVTRQTTAAACAPSHLLGVITNLPNGFQSSAGLPIPLDVQIIDDCGNPLNRGSVSVASTMSDPSVSMLSIGNGQWAGTYLPHTAAGGFVTLTLSAVSATGTLTGSTQISGILAANSTIPIVSPGGVVSGASFAGNAPLAPGGFISVFGSNLGTALTPSNSLPLANTLDRTQVILGGEALPLLFVSRLQINAILPYDVPVNSNLQLFVEQNGMESLPENVLVSAAQPATFTQDQSGSGPGVIVDVQPNGSYFEVTPSTPAQTGDALVIYCAGLGAVSPALEAGFATPSSGLTETASPVTVTIGGRPAQVQFNGMTAGFAGLYQVNVIVPSGITPGTSVPVVLTVDGISGPPATIAISQ